MEMKFTSPRGRTVYFDDYVDNTEEYQSYWAELCPHHHNKYRRILGQRVHDGSPMGTCSVRGCEKDASYYVDFNMNEVTFEYTDEEKSLMAYHDALISAAEALDWTVHKDEHGWELEKYSPAGEDFLFYIPIGTEAIPSFVYDYAQNFDKDEHVRMLLNAKDNGFAGVPSARELVDDADAIAEMLMELADAFRDVEVPNG